MDILYAPWRDKYLTDCKKQNNALKNDCVFCEKLVVKDPASQEFILKKTKYAFVILNIFPYNGGHLLILPYEHVENLEDLSKEVRSELMELMAATIIIVKNVLKVDGINAGLNLGKTSGSIPDHVHLHVVPRWNGDTNFLMTIGQTKSVSVDLEKVYNDLKPAFQALEI